MEEQTVVLGEQVEDEGTISGNNLSGEFLIVPQELNRSFTATDSFVLRVQSPCASAGTIELLASVLSSKQMARVELGTTDVGSERSVSVQSLGLRNDALDFSGSIRFAARIRCDDREEPIDSEDAYLFFHPIGNDWQIYNREMRDSRHDLGALSQEMRDVRDQLGTNARTGFTGSSFVVQLSTDADYIPVESERN